MTRASRRGFGRPTPDQVGLEPRPLRGNDETVLQGGETNERLLLPSYPSFLVRPRAMAVWPASNRLRTLSLASRADTWWSIVRVDTAEPLGDLGVAEPVRQMAEDFEFPLAEPVRMGSSGGARTSGDARGPHPAQRSVARLAAGSPSSDKKIDRARRTSASSLLATSACASSYGHPNSAQADAAFPG